MSEIGADDGADSGAETGRAAAAITRARAALGAHAAASLSVETTLLENEADLAMAQDRDPVTRCDLVIDAATHLYPPGHPGLSTLRLDRALALIEGPCRHRQTAVSLQSAGACRNFLSIDRILLHGATLLPEIPGKMVASGRHSDRWGGGMNVLRWIVACIACCVSCTAFAQPDARADPDALQIIHVQFPKLRVDSTSSGTLDKTGERYLAAMVDDEEAYTIRLVLLGKTAGGWRIVARTQAWQYGTAELWDVDIESGMIELSDRMSGGCCSHGRWTFKFRKHAEGFPLIGVEWREAGAVDSQDDRPLIRVDRKSVDWLNHRVIVSQAVGKFGDLGAYVIAGKAARSEKRMAFRSDVHWTLRNFDMAGYVEHASATPGLCGYFDEHRHYQASCQPHFNAGG